MGPLDCAFLPMAIRCIWEFTLPSSEILQVFSYSPPLRNFFDLRNKYIFKITLPGNKLSFIISNETILPFPWQYTQSAAFFKSLQIFLSILHIYADLIHSLLDPIQLF